jgi:hypothetical protein
MIVTVFQHEMEKKINFIFHTILCMYTFILIKEKWLIYVTYFVLTYVIQFNNAKDTKETDVLFCSYSTVQ